MKYVSGVIEKLKEHKYTTIGVSIGAIVSGLAYLYSKDPAFLYKCGDVFIDKLTSDIPGDIGTKFNYMSPLKEHIAQVIGTGTPPVIGTILGIIADKNKEDNTLQYLEQ